LRLDSLFSIKICRIINRFFKTLKVKIQEDKYEQALQLLIDNGLIEEQNTSNNIAMTVKDIEFDINNVPF
jgi:ABC-type metal ion transport system substrate-binding protein